MDRDERQFRTFRGYQLLKQENAHLTPSMEDYLEMIYRNCLKNEYTRINQLAEQLNVQAPSVTKTVQRLSKMDLVDYEKYGVIKLTKEGERIGEILLERHRLIESFLSKIGVEGTLLKDTEMIEHNISIEALGAIEDFNDFLRDNPKILKDFEEYKKSRES